LHARTRQIGKYNLLLKEEEVGEEVVDETYTE